MQSQLHLAALAEVRHSPLDRRYTKGPLEQSELLIWRFQGLVEPTNSILVFVGRAEPWTLGGAPEAVDFAWYSSLALIGLLDDWK